MAGRNDLVAVRISERESVAIDRRVQELRRSGNKKATRSTVAYEMMRRGSLDDLVAIYNAPDASQKSQNNV